MSFTAEHRLVHHLALAALLAGMKIVWAADGAHIVEDSEVLEPGLCQLQTWVTRFEPGGGYANATPTCTLLGLPRLEWGLQFQHYWFDGTSTTDQLLGPTLKLNLVPESKGIGLGMHFNSMVDLRAGHLELATLLVPLTVPVDDRVRFNFNAGWSYLRIADHKDAFFWGAQVEAKVGWEMSLMLETFGRVPGTAGAQMGLRWRPADGPVEFDLLAGGFFDDVAARFFTVGVTFRW